MSIAKVIEIIAEGKTIQAAVENAITNASKTMKKIKSIYVTEEQQKQLARDQIVIVSLEGGLFELVPKKAAEKIAQRDPTSVIENKVTESTVQADDPYADYQIPDDLVW